MDSLIVRAVSALGELQSSAKVVEVIEQLAATERYDDPPFRHYLSASNNGVSLLFEHDRLITVQVFVEATKTKASCPLVLPFGLKRRMRQADVHHTLGQPISSSETDSRYILDAYSSRLTALFDPEGALRYLSFGRMPIAA